MRQGSLVKLPESKFWWSKKVGIVTETRFIRAFKRADVPPIKESKVEFGSNFVWFKNRSLEIISQ